MYKMQIFNIYIGLMPFFIVCMSVGDEAQFGDLL